MSRKVEMTVQRAIVGNVASTARLVENESIGDAIAAEAIDCIATDVEVTAGGVTMHLAAWQDPDHWRTEWMAALAAVGYGDDADPHGFIAGLATVES